MAYEEPITIEGKVLVCKSLAISKLVHLSLITTVSHAIINQLNIIQKKIFMEQKKAKNKKTLNILKQLLRRWV